MKRTIPINDGFINSKRQRVEEIKQRALDLQKEKDAKGRQKKSTS